MIIDILKEAIQQNIGPLKSAPKNWLKRHCMMCHTRGHGHDTRNRFGIQFNYDNILMNCFNCGFSASYNEDGQISKSLKFFLKNIGVTDDFIKRIEFEAFRQRNSIHAIRDGDPDVAIDLEAKFKTLISRWVTSELPPDALSIKTWLTAGLSDPDFLNVVDYAIRRRIYDLDDFYWSPSTTNNLNTRLIIPYYYNRKIVGFTARLSYDTDSKVIPKYFQQLPTDFVYNLDHQQDWARKYVIVNEGVLDAWATDGVGTLGEIGQTKIDIINRLHKKVIVCPDRDKKGWDLVKAAIDNDWAVSFPKWENGIKDASSASEKYGRLLTTHSIIESAVHGRVRIEPAWDIAYDERIRRLR